MSGPGSTRPEVPAGKQLLPPAGHGTMRDEERVGIARKGAAMTDRGSIARPASVQIDIHLQADQRMGRIPGVSHDTPAHRYLEGMR